MEYDFTFKLSTDHPLTDEQVVHVRSAIAGEIMASLGDGILNTPDEDESALEIRLVDVKPGNVSVIFFDGTTVMIDIKIDDPAPRF